jgi:hypothetical protein
MPDVEDIARRYLREAGGDADAALRRAIGDALFDLATVGGLVSRGYARGFGRVLPANPNNGETSWPATPSRAAPSTKRAF